MLCYAMYSLQIPEENLIAVELATIIAVLSVIFIIITLAYIPRSEYDQRPCITILGQKTIPIVHPQPSKYKPM
jgi:hypothetical protein